MKAIVACLLALAAGSMESPVQLGDDAYHFDCGALSLSMDRATARVVNLTLGGRDVTGPAAPLVRIEEVFAEGPPRALGPEDFRWPASAREEDSSGGVWMRIDGESETRPRLTLDLGQDAPRPLILEGRCKAEFNLPACGWYNKNLALNLRAFTRDGAESPLESAYFGQYNHGPQRNRVVLCPDRPIERAAIELACPRGDVTAWYEGVSLREGRFRRTHWTGPAEQIDTAVRIPLRDRGAELAGLLTVVGRPDCVIIEGRLRSTSDTDRALSLFAELPLDALGGQWHNDPRRSAPIEDGRRYRDAVWYGAGRDGYNSRYPFACLDTADGGGVAVAVPPDQPRVVQFSYDAAEQVLRARFDLGLSPDAGPWANRASFKLYVYPVDPAWGFRDAAARYYALFPWAFKRRADRIGAWLAFMSPRDIAGGWDDFQFQYLESTSDMAWAEREGLDSFKYAEPWIHHHEFPADVEAPEVHGPPIPTGSLEVAQRIAAWQGRQLPLDMRRRYPAYAACYAADAFGQPQGYFFRSPEGGRNENMMIVNPNPRVPGGDAAYSLGAWDWQRIEEAWQTRRQIVVDGWTPARTAAHPFLGLATHGAYRGAQSLVINPIEGKSYFEQYLFGVAQPVRIDGNAGETLAFRYAARTAAADAPQPGYSWSVQFYHPDDSVTTVSLPVPGLTPVWKEMTGEVTSPKPYLAVRLTLSHSPRYDRDAITLLLDEVHLTRGGDSLLVNGGFEDARVAPCRLDGIYLDTMESYEANLNYRRDHWAFTRYPLTFDGARRPAIHQIFSHVGFGQDAAEWAWPRDLLVMGNCVPRTPFAAPWLDVIGNEFDWKHGGHWNPWPDRSFLFARVMAGPKPYCALQYGDLTPEEQAKYLERCLFYAVLPTNQAAPDGSWYWRHAPAVERHRPVFATYLPHIVAVADAGWRPRTLARADTPDLWLERYGAGAKQYLAVFNPNGEPVAGVITLEEAFAGPAPRVNARLGPDIEVQGARRFRIELGPENTALLEVIRQRPAG